MKKFLLSLGVVLLFVFGLILGIMIGKQMNNKCETTPEEKCVANVINYRVFEGEPGKGYNVSINMNTKEVDVLINYGCSYEDCNPTSERLSGTLTDEELTKVLKVISVLNLDNRENQIRLKMNLGSALSNIIGDDNVYVTKDNEDYERFYKEDDLDNDGIVTYREIGNSSLDKIIKEDLSQED